MMIVILIENAVLIDIDLILILIWILILIPDSHFYCIEVGQQSMRKSKFEQTIEHHYL